MRDWISVWEWRAAQSRQARPEEAPRGGAPRRRPEEAGAELGHCQGSQGLGGRRVGVLGRLLEVAFVRSERDDDVGLPEGETNVGSVSLQLRGLQRPMCSSGSFVNLSV